MESDPKNQLSLETSPYLLQHAENPVAWQPYTSAAFQRAQELDRPILLSIGYSACHWCHVMAHESFEDVETAAVMNERFISIKVDREEMPDVDQVYQQALQLQGEQGGWPLTMFLMPDGTPFYGGTYFPKDDRFGRPSFKRLLLALSSAYQNEREKIVGNASQFRDGLKKLSKFGRNPGNDANFSADSIDRAATRLSLRMDRRQGGFEGAPKFPNVSSLSLLLRAAYRARGGESKDVNEFLSPALLTLQKMAAGGIYDQLGGGFSRYSTDAHWLVPHFEKMLYDNALLLRIYSEAYQWTQNQSFARIVQETSDYLERDLRARDQDGQMLGFYTAQDADSEGVEGQYYVWRYDEIWSHLDAASAELVCRVFGVEEGGNWNDPHGHGPKQANILHIASPVQSDLEAARLAVAKQKLLAIRSQRIAPQTDDKILASCNGLALTGLAQAGRIFRDHKLIERATATAHFLRQKMTDEGTGRLFRSYKNGSARFPGTLDDHAFVAEGYIALYEATAEPIWLEQARGITELCLQLFYDDAECAFYLTAVDDGFLIERPISTNDHAVPSGMSVCLTNLLYLAHLTDNRNWLAIVEKVTAAYYERAMENPFAFSNLLTAIDQVINPPMQIVLTGGPQSPLTAPLSDIYLPGRVIAYSPEAPAWCARLLEGKNSQSNVPTAFVCQNYACKSPVVDTEELRASLSQNT